MLSFICPTVFFSFLITTRQKQIMHSQNSSQETSQCTDSFIGSLTKSLDKDSFNLPRYALIFLLFIHFVRGCDECFPTH